MGINEVHKERIEWIDGLKGFACFMIFTHHFMLAFIPATYFGANATSHNSWDVAFAQHPLSAIVNGDFWVFVFCLLSNLLISILALNHQCDRDYISKAMVKRYFRFTLPIAVLGIFVYILQRANLMYTTSANIYAESPWLATLYSNEISLNDLVRVPFFSVLFSCDGTISTALWMLTFVYIGSFISWILIGIFYKRNGYCIFFLCFLAVYVLKCQGQYYLATAPIGALLAIYLKNGCYGMDRIRNFMKRKSSLWIAIVLMAIGFLFGGFPSCGEVKPTNIYGRAIFRSVAPWNHFIGACLMIMGVVLISNKKILNSNVLKRLGQISFEIYLVHIPVIATFSSIVIYKIIEKTNLNYMRIVFLTYVLSIAVLFFIAWVVNKTISKWLNQITEKIVNRLMVKDKTIKLR